MYYDIIIIHLVIAYAHGLHYKYHTQIKMNKYHFNEHKQNTWKCDWLIGHMISISSIIDISGRSNGERFAMIHIPVMTRRNLDTSS